METYAFWHDKVTGVVLNDYFKIAEDLGENDKELTTVISVIFGRREIIKQAGLSPRRPMKGNLLNGDVKEGHICPLGEVELFPIARLNANRTRA